MDIPLRVWALHKILNGVAIAAQVPSDVQEVIFDWVLSQDDEDEYDEDGPAGIPVDELLNDFLGRKPDDIALRVLKVALAVSILRQTSYSQIELSEKQLEETWQLLREALTDLPAPRNFSFGKDLPQKHLKFTVSRGAPGYLAIPICSLITAGKIDELFRIHIWLPDHTRVREEVAIHSHQTDAQSWVIAGQMTNHKYTAEPTADESVATNAEFSIRWNDGRYAGTMYKAIQKSSTARPTERLFVVKCYGSDVHARNATYRMGAGEYHRPTVAGDKLCATLFYFNSRNGEHFVQDAPVMGPKQGTENVQKRHPGAYTASGLIDLIDAVRIWELDSRFARPERGEDEMVTAYYRLISGLAHLEQQSDPDNVGWEASSSNEAMKFLNSRSDELGACPPIVALCKYPSALNLKFLKKLLSEGRVGTIVLDTPDDKGITALDHARQNGDTEAEELIRDVFSDVPAIDSGVAIEA